jgi:outer membrane protein assembly factor BamA
MRQRFFVEPALSSRNRLENLYNQGDRIARYRFRETYGRLDAGVNIATRAQLRIGFEGGRYSAERDTGIDGFPETDGDRDASVYFRIDYDTRDRVDLPTRGTYMNAIYRDSRSWFGSKLDYTLVEGVIQRAFDLNGHSLSLILGGGDTLDGTAPATRVFRLGGLRTFPGLRLWELRGEAYWFAGTSFLWRIAELRPVFGQAVYGGVRLSAGEVRDRIDGAPDATLFGVAGSLTGRTPVGPLLLSLGYVSDASLRLQFSLGRPVAEGSALDAIY